MKNYNLEYILTKLRVQGVIFGYNAVNFILCSILAPFYWINPRLGNWALWKIIQIYKICTFPKRVWVTLKYKHNKWKVKRKIAGRSLEKYIREEHC